MTISVLGKKAMMGLAQEEVPVWLLTLEHDSIAEPIRVCSNSSDITSLGLEYVSFPFEIAYVPDDEKPARVTLRIANLDGRIQTALEAISTPVEATLQMVLASSPDTIEADVVNLQLRAVEADVIEMTGSLEHRQYGREPFPRQSATPITTPGLF